MAFPIPSKQALITLVQNAFRSELPGSDAAIWPSNIFVTGRVIAGATWEVMKRLAFIDKARFVFTATGDQLDAHGVEWGIGRNKPTYAQGSVLVPVTYPYTVPAGTQFTRSDGLIYSSTTAVSLFQFSNTLLLSVPVVCNTIGKIGNLPAAAVLTSSLSGLTGSVAVDDNGLGGGADVEIDTSYRGRLLARKQQPPMGGAPYDYVAWAKEVPGVTRVFVVPLAFGPGTVAVIPLMDLTYPNGIPQLSDIATIQAWINAKAPVTANVFVLAPVIVPVDIIVKNFAPNTQAARLSAGAELFAVFRNMVQPSTQKSIFTLYRSWIWQAVGNATSEQHHEIVSPETDLVGLPGQMFCLNSVTFQ